ERGTAGGEGDDCGDGGGIRPGRRGRGPLPQARLDRRPRGDRPPGHVPLRLHLPAAPPPAAAPLPARPLRAGDRRAPDHGSVCTLRSEEHTSELQSLAYLVCRLLLEKKKQKQKTTY